jgi:uncharacterized membrane protein YgdD (TMEM256/DUF423 family)
MVVKAKTGGAVIVTDIQSRDRQKTQGVVMTFFKRMMCINIFITAVLALSAPLLWVSCELGTNDDGGDDYLRDTLNVDYYVANNAVFFDFSTGTKTVVPHDFFDIAYSSNTADPVVIANSGSYGGGVQVYATGSSNIGDDFSVTPGAAAVKEYTFKTGEKLYNHQTVENPLGALDIEPSKVMLIKVQYRDGDTPEYFKAVFSVSMGTASGPLYIMTVVPGLGPGETGKVEIRAPIGGITMGYGWLYFKLVGAGGPRALNNGTTWLDAGTAAPPLAADWDILAIRATELQSLDGETLAEDMPVTGRSSVLLNIYKNVQAKTVAGKLIDEVADADLSDDGLSGAIDAIGYSWYKMAGMPPVFSPVGNSYVIKTVEGKFAKFQPETFYGPNNEGFCMDFSYSCEE